MLCGARAPLCVSPRTPCLDGCSLDCPAEPPPRVPCREVVIRSLAGDRVRHKRANYGTSGAESRWTTDRYATAGRRISPAQRHGTCAGRPLGPSRRSAAARGMPAFLVRGRCRCAHGSSRAGSAAPSSPRSRAGRRLRVVPTTALSPTSTIPPSDAVATASSAPGAVRAREPAVPTEDGLAEPLPQHTDPRSRRRAGRRATSAGPQPDDVVGAFPWSRLAARARPVSHHPGVHTGAREICGSCASARGSTDHLRCGAPMRRCRFRTSVGVHTRWEEGQRCSLNAAP